jgi:signal transduction histidine kinase
MAKSLWVWVLTGLGCLASGVVGAAEASTEEEAVALVQLAQAYLRENGLAKATVEFNHMDSPFNVVSPINKKGDLYIWSIDSKGLQIIHGKNPKVQGKNVIDMRDVDGIFLIRELMARCYSPSGKGWVSYKWMHPITRETEHKRGYVERVPGMDLCLGSGVYRR